MDGAAAVVAFSMFKEVVRTHKSKKIGILQNVSLFDIKTQYQILLQLILLRKNSGSSIGVTVFVADKVFVFIWVNNVFVKSVLERVWWCAPQDGRASCRWMSSEALLYDISYFTHTFWILSALLQLSLGLNSVTWISLAMDAHTFYIMIWHSAHGFSVSLASEEERNQRTVNTGRSLHKTLDYLRKWVFAHRSISVYLKKPKPFSTRTVKILNWFIAESYKIT